MQCGLIVFKSIMIVHIASMSQPVHYAFFVPESRRLGTCSERRVRWWERIVPRQRRLAFINSLDMKCISFDRGSKNLRSTYFSVMNASRSALEQSVSGRRPAGMRASQIRFDFSFPMISSSWSILVDHLSSISERTLLTCTPSERWTPLHSTHSRIARFVDAHSGRGAPQSAQVGLTCKQRSGA